MKNSYAASASNMLYRKTTLSQLQNQESEAEMLFAQFVAQKSSDMRKENKNWYQEIIIKYYRNISNI